MMRLRLQGERLEYGRLQADSETQMYTTSFLRVIPVKTGIQFCYAWTPACAGVTTLLVA
jgi:hypothetical protein